MDTRFTLLQLKHHCVKATGERDREKPTNHKSESKMGVELDRTREREGGREKALLAHGDMEKQHTSEVAPSERRDLR